MSATPTIKILSDDFESGFAIINEADFDPEIHVPVDDVPTKAESDGTPAKRGRGRTAKTAEQQDE